MLFKKTGKEAENMIRNLGYLAAGVVFGLVVTGLIVNKEIHDQEEKEEVIEDGLFAEIQGNTVRLYKVEEGRFCGYHETREFESQGRLSSGS